MRIIFFGTPDFAVPVLNQIIENEFDVVAVVTAPDKERGRGRKISFTPVKELAIEKNIPVLQPERLKDSDFVESLKSFNADVFVVVAFKILPREVYLIPPKGSFNLHGSLLPKYRGAAPIQWAIINGESKTGLTTFFLADKVDTGNIILSREIEINSDDDLGTLHDKMSLIGSHLTVETLNLIKNGDVKLTPQDNSLSSPAPKITKETCKIDWNNSAISIHNLIRGLSPIPGAFFKLEDKQFKIFKSEVNSFYQLQPGEIMETKNQIFIGCGSQNLKILEIQPEGRRRMTSEEFLRGHSLLK